MARQKLAALALILLMILVAFNNCAPLHSASSKNELSSKGFCEEILKTTFEEQFHSFLKNNCAACHTNGGSGNGEFADGDLQVAYEAFSLRGVDIVSSRALSASHKPPYTGPQHQSAIDQIKQTFSEKQIEFEACNETGELGSEGNNSSKFTSSAKNMFSQTNAKELVWILGQELSPAAPNELQNAVFKMSAIAEEHAGGQKYYRLFSPKLQAGNSALHIRSIEIKINGSLVSSATTYKGIDRKVPAGQLRDLTLTNMIVPYDHSPNDVIEIVFNNLDATDFDPPTFAQLNQAGGVFQSHCVSCHSGANPSAGLDITNKQSLISKFYVIPESPGNSLLLLKMKNGALPMPPAGNLPSLRIQKVEDWISDGAR